MSIGQRQNVYLSRKIVCENGYWSSQGFVVALPMDVFFIGIVRFITVIYLHSYLDSIYPSGHEVEREHQKVFHVCFVFGYCVEHGCWSQADGAGSWQGEWIRLLHCQLPKFKRYVHLACEAPTGRVASVR